MIRSIMIGMPTTRDIPPATVNALLCSLEAALNEGISVEVNMAANSAVLPVARSIIAYQFLKSGREKLFWIDSDMVWIPEDFVKLLKISEDHPVVGAAYIAKTDERQHFMVSIDGAEGSIVKTDRHGCIPIKAMGLGFTVVDREVIAKLSETKEQLYIDDNDLHIPEVFAFGKKDGKFYGEDILFFHNVADLGYQPHLCPSIVLGHLGSKIYFGNPASLFTPMPVS